MEAFNFKRQSCAIALLLLIGVGTTVRAATFSVNCGGREGLTSINTALKALQSSEDSLGPAIIKVSGACHENLVIKDMDRLRIAGTNGASITDASGDGADVVDIRNSRVTITGLTISGQNGVNNDAVDCEAGSQCTLIGNTIQGDGDAVGVYSGASVTIVGGVLQRTRRVRVYQRDARL
jgi:hypothetical protein